MAMAVVMAVATTAVIAATAETSPQALHWEHMGPGTGMGAIASCAARVVGYTHHGRPVVMPVRVCY